MGRHLLHIAVALLAFALGFLFAAPYSSLAYALPLAFLVFALAKAAPTLGADFGSLCVVAASLLCLSAGIYAIFTASEMFYGGSCVMEFSDESIPPAKVIVYDLDLAVSEEPGFDGLSGITVYSCGNDDARPDNVTHNPIWAGVINVKALDKPAPVYPSFAKTARVTGVVAVSGRRDLCGGIE
jgi:hypothetical protein